MRGVRDGREAIAQGEQFATAIAHDLRAPLMSILGFAELMRDGCGGTLSEQHQAFLEQIERAGLRIKALLDEVMTFSRLGGGGLSIRSEPCDFVEVVQDTVEGLMSQALVARLEVQFERPATPCLVSLDVQQVERVLSNLLVNAIKFTPAGGRIRIRLWRGTRFLRCEIEDSGIGIPEAYQAAIFASFHQLEPGLGGGGCGLGLSISKAIVEAHGGSIGVSSLPGKGSTFWFTLPVEPPMSV
ncbi:Non-motile and phage-resistance protein [compost metagenome]